MPGEIEQVGEEFLVDPYALYARLREENPVHPVSLNGVKILLVTRHADVRAALTDPRLGKDADRISALIAGQLGIPAEDLTAGGSSPGDRMLVGHMLNMDPPDHERLRKLRLVDGAAMNHLLERTVLDEHATCLHRVTAAARWPAPMGRGAPAVLGDVARRMPRLARNIAVAHAALFRLTRGRALSHWFGNPILVLETVGRRSGTRRATPLVYLPHRNDFAVVPANAGAHRAPAWWLNLQAAGEGFAVLNGQRQRITPRVATGLERDRLWQLFRAIAPIEHYRCRSRRDLPIVVLTRAGASTSVRRRRSAA